MEQVSLVRPDWLHKEYFEAKWREEDVCTAVMCERDTADVTKLCLESLLRFYPDLPMVIVDGGSKDDSVPYLKRVIRDHPNIKLWERGGRNGHGTMLDEAIRGYVNSKYVLLMDNDLIIQRPGFIEAMYQHMEKEDSYAVGTLMLVTDSNDGCGGPKDENDILRYAHPSCSMIRRETYLTMRPFVEHGAPLYASMQDAKKNGLKVDYFPIECYVSHLSGASWTEPRTVWRDDFDVMIRPFFTFIIDRSSDIDLIQRQTEVDFEVIMTGNHTEENIYIYGLGPQKFTNRLFGIRFKLKGEYVCYLQNANFQLSDTHLWDLKKTLIETNPDEFVSMGLKFVKRKIWQCRESLL